MAARLDELSAGSIVVLDMAILVESNLGRGDPAHSYSRVVVVEAPEALRIERAVQRGMAEADVRARISSQATDAQRRAVADAVIANDGGLEQLVARVDELWSTIEGWRA
jgi:dephospho-CoA kinase